MGTKPENVDPNAVAIIGMAGRFPGAPTLADYWSNLRDGKESIRFYTDEELRESVPPELIRDPRYVNAKGALAEAEGFDSRLFDVSPSDAEMMDPQHRALLECAWAALEDAGYASSPSRDLQAGVFAGCAIPTYLLRAVASGLDVRKGASELQWAIGNDKDFLASRVSHRLGLAGPSVTVQAACATSLVAVHLACQSLLTHECDIALAGGVAITFPLDVGYLHVPGGIASSDGHCRAFDAASDGTVSGNGVGVVVLKRLAEALRDRDTIVAVVLGSAMNNDGSRRLGYTAPSVDGQAQVIAQAFAMAGCDPSTVGLLEAHGTGTRLGDPIEVAALRRVFPAPADGRPYCALGSVKTNIGHLDAAAGVAGLIKAALALRNRTIPPSLHFRTPNPEIDWSGGPFYVPTAAAAWTGSGPRRAAVSSFGLGGTNVHLVIEEAPDVAPAQDEDEAELLVLSAATPAALVAQRAALHDNIERVPAARLDDVAHTLQVGRRPLAARWHHVARSRDAALAALTAETGEATGGEAALAFLFPGQGVAYDGTTASLYAREPVFRSRIDRCDAIVRAEFERGLFAPPGQEKRGDARIDQPAVFAIGLALADLWTSWGVRPAAILGHSLGEYAAACVAGVFDEDDALRLVCRRAELVAQFAPGAMIAVLLGEADTRALLPPALAIAAVNREDLSVVSGPRPAIDAFARELDARRIAVVPVRSQHAFHSAMLDDALPAFRVHVAAVRLRPPQLPVVSNVTGDWLRPEEATDPEYWVRHLRNTVRFADGIARLRERGIRTALELGPGRTLGQWITPKRTGIRTLPTVPSPPDPTKERELVLSTLGQIWQSGVDIDWAATSTGRKRGRIPLPTYPFQRRRYALDVGPAGTAPRPEERTAHEGWYWTLGWAEKAAPVGPATADDRGWLVVALSTETAAEATRLARAAGATRVTTAIPGSGFARLGPGELRFRPNAAPDLARIVEAAREELGELGHVLYTLTLAPAASSGGRLLGDLCGPSFFSPLHLVQALGGDGARVEVIALANGMHRIGAGPAASPEKAALIGLCRVVPREHPNVAFRCIDLPEGATLEAWADRLRAELAGDDRLVAWRGERRLVPAPVPARPKSEQEPGPALRDGGVYLVTGGLGGIGLTLAAMLAREHGAKLVLTSRAGLPTADEWDPWLETHGESDARARAIRAVRAIATAGGEVLALAADVSDRAAMNRVRKEIEARFGVLHGIIHAAGVAGGGMIARKTAREAARVLSPKIIGALVLEEVFGDLPLDFVVHSSSLASLLGDFGQVDYCAANAYLDALGGRPFGSGGAPVLAIDWDTWRDVGMAVSVEVPAEFGAEREKALAHGIDPVEGARAFGWALASGLPQVAVSPRGLPAAIAASLARDPFATTLTTRRRRHQRPESTTPYEAPRTPDEAAIAELWAEALGIDGIGIHDSFFDLGGHSLVAMQLVHRIAERLGRELTLQAFLAAPTIAAIASTSAPPRIEAVPSRVAVSAPGGRSAVPDFSLFFFSAVAAESGGRAPYRLLRESAVFADRHALHAVWVPERHFDRFGGLYPSPSVVLSALSTLTERVKLRAGSVVLPLQNPVRVAEEWSVIDNLSGGRVGVAFASGWHANDFVLAPQSFADRRGTMMRGIGEIRQLWRGETLRLPNGVGEPVEIRVLPRPVQRELPIWLTAQSSEMFLRAGELGANVLTSLLSPNTPQSLAANVAAYRAARAAHGHDPDAGRVTLMLHTFLGPDSSAARELARRDYAEYIRVNVGAQAEHARAAGLVGGGLAYGEEELAALATNAFRRITGTHGLVGTPEECVDTVVTLAALGVDEIACLIDFVADPDAVLDGLPHLLDLRARVGARAAAAAIRGGAS